jgi:hypothetical protein
VRVMDAQVDLPDVHSWALRALRAEEPCMPLPQGRWSACLDGRTSGLLCCARNYAYFSCTPLKQVLSGCCWQAGAVRLQGLP